MASLQDELRFYGELSPGLSYEVVTLHPLADEVAVLKDLGVAAEECTSCDLYWVFREELVFVSFISSWDRTPIVSARLDSQSRARYQFNIVTRRCPLVTADIERGLEYLASWITKNGWPSGMSTTFEVLAHEDASGA